MCATPPVLDIAFPGKRRVANLIGGWKPFTAGMVFDEACLRVVGTETKGKSLVRLFARLLRPVV
jgi:hypothetical protein